MQPPNSARPLIWWHWMDGNITEDGIRKDLSWMKRAGIGGVQLFDVALVTPRVVEKRLDFMSPSWRKALLQAVRLADAEGLEFGIAASPGWSETGGPWVKPVDGMKKLVWSITDVKGGRAISGRLPPPPRITGPFGTIPFVDYIAKMTGGGGDAATVPTAYADVAVIAFPIEAGNAAPLPATSIEGRQVDASALADERPDTAVDLGQAAPSHPVIIDLAYSRAHVVRSATVFLPGARLPLRDPLYSPVLEARVGNGWRRVAEVPLDAVPTTVSFAPVTARAYRLVLHPYAGSSRSKGSSSAPGVDTVGRGNLPSIKPEVKVAQFSLSAQPRVDRSEIKAGFGTAPDYYALSKGVANASGVDPHQVIDLTIRLRSDGTLDWRPPPGRWRIVRFGSSLVGTTNHPAIREATGLEVDKYDATAVRRYFETYLGQYRQILGPSLFGARGLGAVVVDSIETGASNWTPALIAQFRRLRGYDPVPFLPVLAGIIVGDRIKSDAFLYDFRRTLADLLASEHYGTLAAVAHANKLVLFGEALEVGRPQLGDDLAMRSHADVPMAAMWTFNADQDPPSTLLGDLRGAASVAHVYGRPTVAAESLTSRLAPWAYSPADLKHVIDFEFVNGINRPVIHSSVHQPADDKVPGLTLAIYGQQFNRHETWAEMARPWTDYIARSSYLLRQGRNVADIAFFYGEEAPVTALTAYQPLATVPVHHGYDFVNGDMLANAFSVSNGELVSVGGARYRALFLGGTSRRMTLATLRRIAALAEAGATIIGVAPERSPSLGDDMAAFGALTARLWNGTKVNLMGKGRVISSAILGEALLVAGVAPDLEIGGTVKPADIPFIHRSLPDGEIYFLVNRSGRREVIEASFRVAGMAPELWHAENGTVEPLSYRMTTDRTVVPLDLAPQDAVFVVFRSPTTKRVRQVSPSRWLPIATLAGPWEVRFQPGRGAPPAATLARLVPLQDHPDAAIRYFSGEATYRQTVTLPATVRSGGPLMLDLGEVGSIAAVAVNGRSAGYAWHAPFRVDIGPFLRRGENVIEVRVANLWVNRLIGDAQPGARPITFVGGPSYRADAPLRRSGLIGPVVLYRPGDQPAILGRR